MSDDLLLFDPPAGGGEDTLATYAQRAYLEYALSVVKGRALPDVCDGQKPVQRRILYAMQRMGLGHGSSGAPKPVKSARVVGDVLGRFHPHGDQAAYDALVRMAQDFSQRYPLIDGQGNFGSRDGDGAAAMRYTEARLAKITTLLLDEIDEGELTAILDKLRKDNVRENSWSISRFKGLGEMSAVQLWDTTLNPDTRRLLPVTLGALGVLGTEVEFNKLMGKGEAAARREMMELNADDIEVDI